MTDVRARLPLPPGVYSARYIDDMREIVAYRVFSDDFAVRYDWMQGEAQRTRFEKPVQMSECFVLGQSIEDLVAERLADCLKHRGTTK